MCVISRIDENHDEMLVCVYRGQTCVESRSYPCKLSLLTHVRAYVFDAVAVFYTPETHYNRVAPHEGKRHMAVGVHSRQVEGLA